MPRWRRAGRLLVGASLIVGGAGPFLRDLLATPAGRVGLTMAVVGARTIAVSMRRTPKRALDLLIASVVALITLLGMLAEPSVRAAFGAGTGVLAPVAVAALFLGEWLAVTRRRDAVR